jgi:hypothetical protein
MQKSLEDLDWDDENPISEKNVDEWIKLEIGDTLIGVYIDTFTDKQFDNKKYIFQNVTVIRTENGEKQHYNKVGMNSTGNLQFTLDNQEMLGTPMKIIRTEDGEKGDKPKAPHHFKIITPKKRK